MKCPSLFLSADFTFKYGQETEYFQEIVGRSDGMVTHRYDIVV